MLVLLCNLKESLQTGRQEILHSLVFFWEKASIYEGKNKRKKKELAFLLSLADEHQAVLMSCVYYVFALGI